MQHTASDIVDRLRSELTPLRGLWNSIASDLAAMGVTCLADLRGRSADKLVREYCGLVDRPVDPMLQPCFVSIVQFAETGVARPWWHILRADAVRDRESVLCRLATA